VVIKDQSDVGQLNILKIRRELCIVILCLRLMTVQIDSHEFHSHFVHIGKLTVKWRNDFTFYSWIKRFRFWQNTVFLAILDERKGLPYNYSIVSLCFVYDNKLHDY